LIEEEERGKSIAPPESSSEDEDDEATNTDGDGFGDGSGSGSDAKDNSKHEEGSRRLTSPADIAERLVV
jgi:hypothetical protein